MRGDRGVGSRDRLAGAVDDPAPVDAAARGAAGAEAPAREDPAPAASDEPVTQSRSCWPARPPTPPTLRRRLLGWAGGSACDEPPGSCEEATSTSGKPLASWAGSSAVFGWFLLVNKLRLVGEALRLCRVRFGLGEARFTRGRGGRCLLHPGGDVRQLLGGGVPGEAVLLVGVDWHLHQAVEEGPHDTVRR